jgi:hypothetical protein
MVAEGSRRPIARFAAGFRSKCPKAIAAITFLFASGFLVSGAPPGVAPTASFPVMAWDGNAPDAERTFHFSGIRQGCSGAPQSCMRSVSDAHARNLKVFLSILLKPETIAYGEQYSQLSRGNSALEEIGVDDFVSQYSKLYQAEGQNATGALNALITGAKLVNPNLHFGITVYEDDLTRSPEYLSDPKLPAGIRAKIDYVHFYVHFRADSPQYAKYLNQVKAIFPSARMIAGVYPYDRISYVPCALESNPCTPEEEMKYFNAELDAAIDLLKSGAVAWLEFYPGNFGREEQWTGWSSPRMCTPERRQACIDNTKQMHEVVLNRLNQLFR